MFGSKQNLSINIPNTLGQQGAIQQAGSVPQGLFGQSAGTVGQQQPAATTSLFGQQPQQNTGLFGQKSTGMFSQPAAQPTSLFGGSQQQFGQVQQVPQQPNQPAALDYIKAAAGCWDLTNPSCQFKHYFYNLVHVSEVHLYQPSPGEDKVLYEQAVKDNPDPSCMVPVLAVGFEGLKTRITMQEKEQKNLTERLDEFRARLDALRQKHTVQTLVKIEEFQRKQRQIEHSVFQLLKLVQVMRNRGYSLRAEEEVLITRLVAMDRDLAKPSVFRGRLNEVWSHISQMRDQDHLSLGNEFSLVDPNSLEPVCKVLEGIGKGLSELTMVVKEDEASIEKFSRGYQDP